MTACPSKILGKLKSLFSLLFRFLEINTFSKSFLNFNFEIAGQKLEGVQKHFQIAFCKFSPIESHFHQVYVKVSYRPLVDNLSISRISLITPILASTTLVKTLWTLTQSTLFGG